MPDAEWLDAPSELVNPGFNYGGAGLMAAAVAAIGRSGRSWGGAGSPFVLGSAVIPGGSIKPGSLLRLRGLLAKLAPFNGGGSISVSLKQGANSVVIAQTSLGATVANYPFAQDLQLSYDRKWAFPSGTNTSNVFGQASTVAGTYSINAVLASSAPIAPNPRAQGPIAFASYTAPPTVETILIDFNSDVTLSVAVGIVSGDSMELLYCTLESVVTASNGFTSGPLPVLFAGDSLIEGTGSTTDNDLASVVGKARPGRGVLNFGLGGQTITSIVGRVLADPVAGRSWDLILWAGINDVGSDATAWFATIQAQITRLQAFRAPGSRMMILNFHPSSAWTAPQKAALEVVNASLLTAYGSLVVDVYTALGTTGGVVPAGNLADVVHLNNTGYALVKDAVIAKMTALGWT